MSSYQHVILVGIDGAGSFFKDAKTPCFDRIFENGAVTYRCLSVFPTISAQCWGSMLTGVQPELHGLTNHSIKRSLYPMDSPFPTVFSRIRKALPEAELGAFCEWDPLLRGLVERELSVTEATSSDTYLTKMIGHYIWEKRPAFLFVQIDSVDEAGHRFGYGSSEHLAQIEAVDAFIGDMYEAVLDAGMADSTLFCVVADHGGTPLLPGMEEATHGGWTENEKFVTFAASGKTVRPGVPQKICIRDLAAVLLHSLGIETPTASPDSFASQIPEDLFNEPGLPSYLALFSDEYSA